MDSYISGANASLSYAYEEAGSYNNEVDSHNASTEEYVAFGRGIDVSVSRNQNKERVYAIGDRNAIATVTKQFSGSLTVNGTLSNAYWLLGLLGKNTDGGVSKAYTHTYTEANCLPTMTIKRAISFGDTEGTEIFIGGTVNSGTITSAVNEAVKFSLEIPYRFEELDESTAIENIIDSENIFTFAGASLSVGGVELAGIENFEIAINNSSDLEYGLGSRYAEAVVSKNREYNISYTAKIKDYTRLKQSLSANEIATLKMEFEDCSGNKLEFNFEEFHINEDNLPASPTELIKEDCSGWAHKLTSAVYTNKTEIAPKEDS